jgi:DNA replication and repair protein RecF
LKTIEPVPGLNFFIGPNAQGKTSLLEAACVLLRLKSPRTHLLAEALRFKEKAFCLEGNYGDKKLSMRFAPYEKNKRLLQIDDVMEQETNHYLKMSSVVWFGTNDRDIVNGPGERRRAFLDSAGLQLSSEYRSHWKLYEKALRSRNMLLRAQRPRREIDAYDSILCENGDALMHLRAMIAHALSTHAADACQSISEEKLMLTYQPGATIPLREALEHSRAKETQLAMTVVGPHRDELLLTLNDIPTAIFGSEGQRRTVALALKLALAHLLHYEQSIPPLLLLDDVFGDLDTSRRQALLLRIPKGSQALFTTTELESSSAPDQASFFNLF